MKCLHVHVCSFLYFINFNGFLLYICEIIYSTYNNSTKIHDTSYIRINLKRNEQNLRQK